MSSSSTTTFDPYSDWLNIPPHERPINHYRLLGLALFESDAATIRAAADERMRLMRTFQTGPRSEYSQQLMNELARAKTCLVDQRRRANYDAQLRAYLAPAVISPPVQPPPLSVANSAVQPPPLATTASASPAILEFDEPDEPSVSTPFYLQPWFPIIIVAGLLLIGVSAWAVAVAMRSGQREREAALTPPAELPMIVTPDEPPESEDESVVIMQEAGGELNLSAGTATLAGGAGLEVRDGINYITGIASVEDQATWHFRIEKAGAFRIEATYATASAAAGGTYRFVTDKHQTKLFSTRDTGGSDSFSTERIGFIWLRRAGEYQLTLVPQTVPEGESLMTLQLLRLIPVSGTGG